LYTTPLCILYHWSEDNPLRLKNVAMLNDIISTTRVDDNLHLLFSI